MPLIRALLAGLIALYRRFLAGRGPFRNVRCSFARDESCSTFGLRAVAVAPSIPNALGRIARRLRRCRDACLLSDGRTLSWSRFHDRPPGSIVAELQEDDETPAATARMLQARRAVAAWRGDIAAVRACDGASAEPPRVCARRDVLRFARRRIVLLVSIAIAVAAASWPLGLLIAFAAVGVIRATRERARRFAVHATWAARRRQRSAGVSAGTGIACPVTARPA